MNMSTTCGRLLPLALVSFFTPALFAQAPITPGNLVVARIGDGTAALSSAAQATFLDEYTTTGTFVQTLALPTAPSGLNFACTSAGTTASTGYLGLADNGLALLVGGFDAAPGTTAVAQTVAPSVRRTVAVVNPFTSTIDTSTGLTDAFDTSGSMSPGNAGIRSVTSPDGVQIITAGTGFPTSNAGCRYSVLGASTSTQLNSATTNNRVVQVFLGQLYVTTMTGTNIGLNSVGTGVPTSPGAVVQQLTSIPALAPDSVYDLYFASPHVVYLADDRASGTTPNGGGIQKWTETGGVWSYQYTITFPLGTGTHGMRGLSGVTNNGVSTLYATANGTNGTGTTQIVTCVDTGPASVVTSLVTSPTNTLFRGIRYFAKPSSLQRIPTPCGPRTIEIAATGSCEIGTDQHTRLSTLSGLGGLIALDINGTFVNLNVIPFLPLCDCVLGVSVAPIGIIGANDFTLNISPLWAPLGLQVFIQGIDYLPPVPGCPELTLDLSDTYVFTVQ